MARRGRLPMLVAAGAASAVVLLSAVLSWPRILEEYRLRQLRGNPLRLEEFLLAEGSAKDRAAAAFVREPGGKAALFRLYLGEFDTAEGSFNVGTHLLKLAESPYKEGTLALSEDRATVEILPPGSGRHTFSYASVSVRRRRILELLDACAGERFHPEGFEGLEFQLQPLVDGQAPAPSWRKSATITWSSRYSDLRYLCFFRVVRSAQ